MILSTTKRIGYNNKYAVIIPDHGAGCSKRYTVYLLPSSPSRRTHIVGRELTLDMAKKIAEYLVEK